MVKKMTTKNEHLSAVFDDEAGDFEQRRLVDELTKDSKLQHDWSRYALIGDVLREPEQAEVAMPEFLSGIQQQLEAEEEFSQVKVNLKKQKSAWVRPVTGFAMAATIAAVSVLGVQSLMTENSSTERLSTFEQVAQNKVQQTEASQTNTSKKSAIRVASNDTASRNVVDMEQRIKVQRYLASHIKNASHRTIAPTMRVISYNYQ